MSIEPLGLFYPVNIQDPPLEEPILREHHHNQRWTQGLLRTGQHVRLVSISVHPVYPQYGLIYNFERIENRDPLTVRVILKVMFVYLFSFHLLVMFFRAFTRSATMHNIVKRIPPNPRNENLKLKSLEFQHNSVNDVLAPLPLETTLSILSYLSIKDLFALRRVSRTWFMLFKHYDTVWKPILKSHLYPRLSVAPRLDDLVKYHRVINKNFFKDKYVESFTKNQNLNLPRHLELITPNRKTFTIKDQIFHSKDLPSRWSSYAVDNSEPVCIKFKGVRPDWVNCFNDYYVGFYENLEILIAWPLAGGNHIMMKDPQRILTQKLSNCAVSGNYLYAFNETYVACWDLKTGNYLNNFGIRNPNESFKMMEAYESHAIIVNNNSEILVWDVNSQDGIKRNWFDNTKTIPIHRILIYEEFLFTCNAAGVIRRWDWTRGVKCKTYTHSLINFDPALYELFLWHGIICCKIENVVLGWDILTGERKEINSIHPYIRVNGLINKINAGEFLRAAEFFFLPGKIIITDSNRTYQIIRDYTENAKPLPNAIWTTFSNGNGAIIDIA